MSMHATIHKTRSCLVFGSWFLSEGALLAWAARVVNGCAYAYTEGWCPYLRIPSWINDCRSCRRHKTITKLRLQVLAQ